MSFATFKGVLIGLGGMAAAALVVAGCNSDTGGNENGGQQPFAGNTSLAGNTALSGTGALWVTINKAPRISRPKMIGASQNLR